MNLLESTNVTLRTSGKIYELYLRPSVHDIST